MTEKTAVDFTSPSLQTCPFGAYEEIRAQPFYREPSTGYLVVTSYDLIRQIVSDPDRFANQAGALLGVGVGPKADAVNAIYEAAGFPQLDVLVSGDPPDHPLHRSLVNKAFTIDRVKKMETYLQTVVDEYIDRIVDKGAADFQKELADMIPTAVIADQLGVPRADLPDFKRWSDASVAKNNPASTIEEAAEFARTRCELLAYLADTIEAYRRTPANCILSDLVHAEVDGRRLTRDEVINIAALLIVAGNETTTSAIANCFIRLIDEGLEDRLRAEPSLITEFVEEELRIDAPIQGLFRRTTEDVELAGEIVPANSILMLKWGAANRDPAKFEDPDRFDLMRRNKRQHITFGYGAHFCVGTMLARSEINITMATALRRMKRLRYADRPDPVMRRPNYLTFGVEHLHIAFDRA